MIRNNFFKFAVVAFLAAAILFGNSCGGSHKNAIRIAVASNFAEAAKEIAKRFKAESGIDVQISIGSTGKHFAQITNGAPFDVFLAADSKRPRLLESQGSAKSGTRFTYAFGRLVLWGPSVDNLDVMNDVPLFKKRQRLAIANPKLAPYGVAAMEHLKHLKLENAEITKRLVVGENVSQAFHFVASGNADIGYVALSQVRGLPKKESGSYWIIPPKQYTPIEQQAILLTDKPASIRFANFLKDAETLELIRSYGYLTP